MLIESRKYSNPFEHKKLFLRFKFTIVFILPIFSPCRIFPNPLFCISQFERFSTSRYGQAPFTKSAARHIAPENEGRKKHGERWQRERKRKKQKGEKMRKGNKKRRENQFVKRKETR